MHAQLFDSTALTNEPALRSKLELIELVETSGNVSTACKRVGYSRDTYYRIRNRYNQAGIGGLIHRSRGKSSKKRLPAHIRQLIVAIAISEPLLGRERIARIVARTGFEISSSGVRSVLKSFNLEKIATRESIAKDHGQSEALCKNSGVGI